MSIGDSMTHLYIFSSIKDIFIQYIELIQSKWVNVWSLHDKINAANTFRNSDIVYYRKINKASLRWRRSYLKIAPPSMLGENLFGSSQVDDRKKVHVIFSLQDISSRASVYIHE